LLKIAKLHQLYTEQIARLKEQQSWLIELQRILETEPEPSSREIEDKINRYLLDLSQHDDLNEADQVIAQHVISTFRNRWWGLFVCYDTPGLPATNNDLESFFGRLKTNQRRITGRKSVNNFVLGYGAYVAFVDLSETKTDLLNRLRRVDRTLYQQERQQLQLILDERREYYRFQHKLDIVVKELENEWQIAVEAAAQSSKSKPIANLP
jgi:transposase InsO family protein